MPLPRKRDVLIERGIQARSHRSHVGSGSTEALPFMEVLDEVRRLCLSQDCAASVAGRRWSSRLQAARAALVRPESSSRSDRLGEPFDEVERRLGHLARAVVDREGVASVRHLHDLRVAGVSPLAFVGGGGDRPRHRVVLLAVRGADLRRSASRSPATSPSVPRYVTGASRLPLTMHALDELALDKALSGSGSRPRRTPVFITDATVTSVGVPQTRSRRESRCGQF